MFLVHIFCIFLHKDFVHLILNQLTKFQYQTFSTSQDIKQVYTYQFHRIGPIISLVLINLFGLCLRVYLRIGILVLPDFLHEVRGP